MVVSSKSCKFWRNRWFLVRFHGMRHFLQLLAQKFMKIPRHGSLLQKLKVLAKWIIFCAFSRNEALFATFSWKVYRNAKIWYFVRKVAKFWPNRWFFEQTTMFCCFDELFSKRGQKVAQFVKQHEKSSIWPKLCNFSSKLPCLCISMNCLGKSCKKCLISWESTKNYQFGENLQLFEQTTMFFLAFSWTFQQKVAKSASFGEKAREIIDLPKTIQLFEQTTMFLHFDELLRKRWEKGVHFVKKHEN